MLPAMPVRPRRRRLVTLCGAVTVSAISVAAATLCACGGSGGGEKRSGDAGGQGMANVAPTPIEDAKAAGGRSPSLIGAKRLAGPFADLSALCRAKKLHAANEGYDPSAEDAAERCVEKGRESSPHGDVVAILAGTDQLGEIIYAVKRDDGLWALSDVARVSVADGNTMRFEGLEASPGDDGTVELRAKMGNFHIQIPEDGSAPTRGYKSEHVYRFRCGPIEGGDGGDEAAGAYGCLKLQ